MQLGVLPPFALQLKDQSPDMVMRIGEEMEMEASANGARSMTMRPRKRPASPGVSSGGAEGNAGAAPEEEQQPKRGKMALDEQDRFLERLVCKVRGTCRHMFTVGRLQIKLRPLLAAICCALLAPLQATRELSQVRANLKTLCNLRSPNMPEVKKVRVLMGRLAAAAALGGHVHHQHLHPAAERGAAGHQGGADGAGQDRQGQG